MKTEKIKRTADTATRAANVIIRITAEEGHMLVNQAFIDYKQGFADTMPELIICSQAYLADADSPLNYAEITDEEATAYQNEYDETQRQAMEREMQQTNTTDTPADDTPAAANPADDTQQ